jgi:hypothetical protein
LWAKWDKAEAAHSCIQRIYDRNGNCADHFGDSSELHLVREKFGKFHDFDMHSLSVNSRGTASFAHMLHIIIDLWQSKWSVSMTQGHTDQWRIFKSFTQRVEATCVVFAHMYVNPVTWTTPSVTELLDLTRRLIKLVESGPTDTPPADASPYAQNLHHRLQGVRITCTRVFKSLLRNWIPEATEILETFDDDAVRDDDKIATFIVTASEMVRHTPRTISMISRIDRARMPINLFDYYVEDSYLSRSAITIYKLLARIHLEDFDNGDNLLVALRRMVDIHIVRAQGKHGTFEYSKIDILFLREIEELIYEVNDFAAIDWYQIRCICFNEWVRKIIVCKSYTLHTVTPANRKSFSAFMMQMVFLDSTNTYTHTDGSITSALH